MSGPSWLRLWLPTEIFNAIPRYFSEPTRQEV